MFSFCRALLIFTMVSGLVLTGYSQLQDKEQSKAMYELAGEMLKGSMAEDDVRDILVQASDLDTTNLDANFQAGYLHIITIKKEQAVKYLLRVYRQRPTYRFDLEFQIGQSYHFGLQFDKAIDFYNRYKNTYRQRGGSYQGKDKIPIPVVDRKIYECNNGKNFVAHPKPYAIVNMGPQINSESGDYAPVLNEREDEIIFTSRRLDGNLNENVFSDNKPFEDIFISTKANGKWTKAANIGRTVNIPDHNSNLALSPDGKTLFQYRSDNGGDIYISELQSNGSWSTPRPIPGVVNSPYYESSMSISPDGQTLYFASERPGGLGGMDIYSCIRDRRGVWGRLKNLGPTINTAGHDDSPFIDYSGKKLYFSSDSHKGMGGYDIYETTLINESKNEWSEPVNLGYPINTADNDIYFVGTSDGKRGYYASVREDGLGYLDIYAVIPKDMIKEPAKALPVRLVVKVIDAKTNSPLDASVELLSVSDSKPVAIASQSKGNYTFSLITRDPKNYRLSVRHDGYFPQVEEITLQSADVVEKTVNRTVGMAVSEKTVVILPLKYVVKVVDAKTNTPLSASTLRLESTPDNVVINSVPKGAGTFEFSVISPNAKSYRLITDCPGYESQTQTFNLDGASATEKTVSNTVKLIEAKKVPLKYVVKVIDSKTNQPIDADVKLQSVAGKLPIAGKAVGNGIYEFSITAITTADYALSVNKNGYTSQNTTVSIEGTAASEKTINKSINLEPKPVEVVIVPLKLSVKIVDEKTNKSLAASLKLTAPNESDRVGMTNAATGVFDFSLSSATAKEYTLTVSKSGYTSKSEKFLIEGAGTSAKTISKNITIAEEPAKDNVPSSGTRLVVTIVDKNTKKPIDEANVVLQSAIENKEVAGKPGGVGVFEFYVTSPTAKNYKLSVDKEGYVFMAQQLRIEGAKESAVTMTRTVQLNPIAVGATSVLRNLFFDLGRASIQQESFPELNAFVNMMKKNPSVKVEIAGHTDDVGDATFNLRLSLLRANAVRSYLVSKGISASRMSTKGYGESRPLVSNDDEIGGREINRRVELKILSK